MEVLELDGMKFVKATSIARDLGYTADYVGQLCRSGKIAAHLVGRSWYVEEESIRGHKSTRYRSTKEKTRQALQVTLKEREEVHAVPVHTSHSAHAPTAAVRPTHHFYTKLSPKSVNYDEDDSDLIPTLTEKKSTQSTKLEVSIVGAENLKIKEGPKSYALKATELPKIKFSGGLKVKTSEEPVETLVEGDKDGKENGKENKVPVGLKNAQNAHGEVKHVHVKDISKAHAKHHAAPKGPKSTKAMKSDLENPRRKSLKAMDMSPNEEQVAVHRSGTVTMARSEASDEHQLTIKHNPAPARSSARATFLYITSSTALALLLAFGVMFVEESISSGAEEGSQTSHFSVNFTSVLDTIESFK